jgi:hypothetical protein
MTVYGTLVSNQPSSVGKWSECTLATAFPVTGTTTSAAMSIVYGAPALQSGQTVATGVVFSPSLPVGCIVLNPATATSAANVAYSTLQNGTNNVLTQQSTMTGGIGLASCILGVASQSTNTSTGLVSYTETGTLSLTWVNAGATSTLTAGTRLLFLQSQGN